MDAAFFRFLGPEIATALRGVRFDTVYGPAPGFWTLAFSPPVPLRPDAAPPPARFVLVRSHPRLGTLFLSPDKPANPPSPPAVAMRLRKLLRGRAVLGHAADWPTRTLALELSAGEGRWLLIGPEADPAVVDALPDGFGAEPAWKTPAEVLADPAAPRSLRRAVGREDPGDDRVFLDAFLAGRSGGFFLPEGSDDRSGPLPWPAWRSSRRFATALEAALEHGRQAFFAALAPAAPDPAAIEARRRKRLELLDRDQTRLTGLVEQQAFGDALAANLAGLDPRGKSGPLLLEHPERGPLTVPLDPSLTVLENMRRFYAKAAKGRRGLKHVERQRAEVLAGVLPPPRDASRREHRPSARSGGTGKAIALHRYRSSDGFTILRGRNAAANHRLLTEAASPFDYWFHAQDGPGAHVILKRDHPGQEVPRTSLEEAAALAGLAGWQAGEAKARVIWALAGDVRAVKGAPLGQVRLDKASSLIVALDPGLESRLRHP